MITSWKWMNEGRTFQKPFVLLKLLSHRSNNRRYQVVDKDWIAAAEFEYDEISATEDKRLAVNMCYARYGGTE